MTAVFPARRAAEFEELVELGSTGPLRDAQTDTRTAELLGLVAQLRAIEPVEPDAAFSASLREELLAAADTLLMPSAETKRLTLPPRRTARDRRIAAVIGGFAVVGATTSLAVAAQSALPGEMLYPLKRAMETAETQVFTSDEAQAASMLAHATDRLAEVSELSRTAGLTEASQIAHTLVSFSDQSLTASEVVFDDYAETGDPAPVEDLRDFTATSMQTLAALEALLPAEAHDELVAAAEVLTEIDTAAAAACPSCAGGITQIPSVLLAASAGRLTVPDDLVVVPSPIVDSAPSGSSGTGDTDRRDGTGKDTEGEKDHDDGGVLPDDPILGDDDPSTPETDEDDSADPLGGITDPLTTGGGTTQGDDSDTGSGPLDDAIDDTVEGLEDGLGEVEDGLTDLP